MSNFKKRTLARELIVQTLYAAPQCNISISDLMHTIVQECYANTEIDIQYAESMINSIATNKYKIHQKIQSFVSRDINKINDIELAILSLGVLEIINNNNIDSKVTLNECINIAKKYGAQGSHKFINACLDKFCKSIKSQN